MGFSSALQGRAAHEALIVRQDAELRLMETMKRSIMLKAKFDKEYAMNLASVAQLGLKIDRTDELHGSTITKSWRSYMEELDQQAKQFRTNAELLEIVCDKILHLSQDKRKARKAYQEEHGKIASRLNHLTDEVLRKKSEYQKHLEGYKALRTRFEEHYIKSGRGGRKLDDVREKYQKACRKLHLTHNEYVLSICEAVEVERDFRTVLLPGLLEHQQALQESYILVWKNILQDVTQHGDLTSDKFRDIQRRIDIAMNSINPVEEYREFTEKHKTSPAAPVLFQFDETLIEDIHGKLQPNSLTVDNLTIDWLRSRLNDMESSVRDCQERQEKLVCDLNGSGTLTNGINGIGKELQKQSKDLNSLRCQEKQKQKLADLIKTALNEVGCEELPSGCDDLSVEQNFIENGYNDQQAATSTATTTTTTTTTATTTAKTTVQSGAGTASNASTPIVSNSTPVIASTPTVKTPSSPTTPTSRIGSAILQKGSDVISIIKAPFKRISGTNTPKSKVRSGGSTLSEARTDSVGSISVNTVNGTALRPCTLNLIEANDVCDLNSLIVVIQESEEDGEPVSTNIYAELAMCSSYSCSMSCDTNKLIGEDVLDPTAISSTNQEPSYEVPLNRLSSGIGLASSIDAHLDKVDEINKTLDNRMSKTLPCNIVTRTVCWEALKSDTDTPNTNATLTEANSPDNNETVNRDYSTQTEGLDDQEVPASPSRSNVSKILNTVDTKLSEEISPTVGQDSLDGTQNAVNIAEYINTPTLEKVPSQASIVSATIACKTDERADEDAKIEAEEDDILESIRFHCASHASAEDINSKKRGTSFSQKSINAIFTTFRDMKFPNFSSKLDKRIDEPATPTAFTSKSSLRLSKRYMTPVKQAKAKPLKPVKKAKFGSGRFRSRLQLFNLKKSRICDRCSKKRKIHPSRSVFDFAKEFHTDTMAELQDICFCNDETLTELCEVSVSDDDTICIKEHTYCEPFGVSNQLTSLPDNNIKLGHPERIHHVKMPAFILALRTSLQKKQAE